LAEDISAFAQRLTADSSEPEQQLKIKHALGDDD
jgi:hypothetical protein